MQYLKDKGFIIKRVDFGDSDRYLTLFTNNHGKIEVVAKGVRKINSRRASNIELVNLIDFQAVKTAKNFILTEVSLVSSFYELKSELKHMQKVFLTCELIDSLMADGVVHSEVFDLMHRALLNIREDEKNMLYFQAKLVSLLGFWDGKKAFKSADHLKNHIESILERKLRTDRAFA